MHDLLKIRQELDRLRSRVAVAESQLQQFRRVRHAQTDLFKQIRWARTCDPASGSYPLEAAAPTVFPFKFLDAEFEPTIGAQAFTATARSTAQAAVGYSDTFIPNGTDRPVFWLRGLGTDGDEGEWFFFPAGGKVYVGKSNAAIPEGSTTGSVSRYNGGTETDTGIDDTVVNKWPEIPTNTWVIYAPIGSAKYILAPAGSAAPSTLYFETASDRNPASGSFSATNLVALHGTAPGSPLTIHDPDILFPRALAGGNGIATWDATNGRYQCVYVQQQCLMARALINTVGGMSGSVDEIVPIDNFEALSNAPFNLVPATLPTSARNRQRHRGRDNHKVILAWDEVNDEWLIVDVEKQQAVQLYDLRYDSASGQVQAKQAYAAVESDEDLSALTWTNKIPVTTCP